MKLLLLLLLLLSCNKEKLIKEKGKDITYKSKVKKTTYKNKSKDKVSKILLKNNKEEIPNQNIIFYKNSIYKYELNKEFNILFKKNKVFPMIKIENAFKLKNRNNSYSIWLVRNTNNFYLYFSVFDNFKDLLFYNGINIYRNKKLNKIKTIKMKYFTYIYERESKNNQKIKIIEKSKIGKLSFYKKRLKRKEKKKIKSLIFQLQSVKIKSCYSNSNYTSIPAKLIYITSQIFNQLPFQTHQVKHTGNGDYDNNDCIKVKNIVDYLFELSSK